MVASDILFVWAGILALLEDTYFNFDGERRAILNEHSLEIRFTGYMLICRSKPAALLLTGALMLPIECVMFIQRILLIARLLFHVTVTAVRRLSM